MGKDSSCIENYLASFLCFAVANAAAGCIFEPTHRQEPGSRFLLVIKRAALYVCIRCVCVTLVLACCGVLGAAVLPRPLQQLRVPARSGCFARSAGHRGSRAPAPNAGYPSDRCQRRGTGHLIPWAVVLLRPLQRASSCPPRAAKGRRYSLCHPTGSHALALTSTSSCPDRAAKHMFCSSTGSRTPAPTSAPPAARPVQRTDTG